MNYDLLKKRMDKFFEKATPDQLVSKFEKLGYTFIDTTYHYLPIKYYDDIKVLNRPNQDIKPKWFKKYVSKEKMQNLDKFEVFLCNIVIC